MISNYFSKIAALTLLASFPVLALCDELQSSGLDGFVSAAFSKPQFENIFKGLEKEGFNYRASAAWQSAAGFGAQVDFAEMQQTLGDDPELTLIPRSSAVHLFFRNNTLLAGFLYQEKRQKIDVSGETVLSNFIPRNITAIEGQWYADQLTGYAQLGRQRFSFDPASFHVQGDIANFQLRFYTKNNWLISAGYSYSSLNAQVIRENMQSAAFVAGVEYQVDGTPISLFAQHMDIRYQVGGEARGGAGLSQLGMKLSWGTANLQQRDRFGASLDPIGTDGLFVAPETER